jgi:hypothetical protein
MSRNQSYGSIMLLILSALLIGPAPKVLSQGRERKQIQSGSIPKVPVFRGAGGTNRTTSRKLPPPPPPPQILSSGFTNQIFNGLGGKPVGEFCKVTPQQPHVADRCYLNFDNFSSLRSDENMASAFYETSPAIATLSIKPLAASKKYLIDCAVHPLETQPLDVYGNFLTTPPFPAKVSPTNNHLLLAVDATSSNWLYFQMYKNDLTPFYFYGCTITEYVPQASPSTIPTEP